MLKIKLALMGGRFWQRVEKWRWSMAILSKAVAGIMPTPSLSVPAIPTVANVT
jgi:hypothetical protein